MGCNKPSQNIRGELLEGSEWGYKGGTDALSVGQLALLPSGVDVTIEMAGKHMSHEHKSAECNPVALVG